MYYKWHTYYKPFQLDSGRGGDAVELSFGKVPPGDIAPERLYAFAMDSRGIASVYDFSADSAGLEELSSLIRSHSVQAVVRGTEVPFEMEVATSIMLLGSKHETKQSLLEKRSSRGQA